MQIKNFYYSFPTIYYFGQNSINNLEQILPNMTKNLLVVCGMSSAKKLGILDSLNSILNKLNISYTIYQNCPPNPSKNTVQDLVNIVEKSSINMIIAIGGGSVIDASKACVYELKDKRDVLLGTILTNPSSGSEANRSFVIYDKEFENKIALADSVVIPKFAIVDSEYTKTLTDKQIAGCLSDIMAHLLEQFFVIEDWNMIDDLIVGAIKTLVRIAKSLKSGNRSILAMQDLMLVSTFSLSYLLSCGRTMDWVAHTIEHAISGKYKTNHAIGMSIIMPKWIEFSLNNEYYKYRLVKLMKELGYNADNMDSTYGLNFIKKFFYDLNQSKSFSDFIEITPDLNVLSSIIVKGDFIGRVNKLSKEQCRVLLGELFS